MAKERFERSRTRVRALDEHISQFLRTAEQSSCLGRDSVSGNFAASEIITVFIVTISSEEQGYCSRAA